MKLPDPSVRAVLDEVNAGIGANDSAVLVAPPGTGKTTVVPLTLAEWRTGHRTPPTGRTRRGRPDGALLSAAPAHARTFPVEVATYLPRERVESCGARCPK